MASRKVLFCFLRLAIALILAAAISYRSTYSSGFPPSLEALGGSTGEPRSCQHAPMIGHHWASGFKAGYRFIYSPLYDARSKLDKHRSEIAKTNGCATFGRSAFGVSVYPEEPSKRGQHYYYTRDTGVLRVEIDKLALGNNSKRDGKDC
jgi:hypothetical protein